MVGGVQRQGGAHGGRGLEDGLRLLAPSHGGSSSGRGWLGVARWCTWAAVFNGSLTQQWHGVALRRVFNGSSIGCAYDDLRREYRMVRHSGYGEHMRRGELWRQPAWRRAAVLTEGTAATASDRSGLNASAFKGMWRGGAGWHVEHDVSHGLQQAGPGGGDGH
jgi:hypothetical protein